MTTRAISLAFLCSALLFGCADSGLAVEGTVVAAVGDSETRFDFPGRVALLAPSDPGADEVFSGICRRVGDGSWELLLARPGPAPEGIGLARFAVESSTSESAVRATLGSTRFTATSACEVTHEDLDDDDDDDIDEDEDIDEDIDEADGAVRVRVECTLADSEGNEAQISSELTFTGCAG